MHFLLIFIPGIVIGSFLNVCICRIPEGESVVYPSSRCTYCGTPLKWYDLIPVLSYLSLKGKCRYCGGSISPQYPIVELLNGLLYLYFFYKFGLSPEFIFYCIAFSILMIISFIDYYKQIIPDGLLLIFMLCVIIYKIINLILYNIPLNIRDGIFGFIFGGLVFFIIAIVSNGAMGGGDIKLIAVLGFIIGLKKTILNILLSFIIGAVISVFLLLSRKKGRKDAIPFGPFINIAFFITVFYGESIMEWYILTLLR